MASPILLQSKIKWNPISQAFPFRTCNPVRTSSKFISRNPKFMGIRCSCKRFISSVEASTNNLDKVVKNLNRSISESFVSTSSIMDEALMALRKPVVAGVLVGCFLLLQLCGCNSNPALAASGGRVGGSSFSSHSSSSSSSRGGYSSNYRFSSPSPSYYYSYPSRSYMSVPYSSSFSIFAIIGGLFAFMVVSDLLKSDGGVFSATGKTTVVKLQVGLLGMARSLQSDLNRIANTADTSSQKGLSYVLTETVLALLRHPDYCISGYSSVDLKRSIEDGEKCFNQLSIEERGKFDEETLVNVNSIRKQNSTSQTASGFRNEYIVITILVAAEGEHKLPAIKSSGDLKAALEMLGSIPSSKIMAVEVLWTPQNENDTLTERELLEDYSLLRPL